jgi:hypothetical protein
MAQVYRMCLGVDGSATYYIRFGCSALEQVSYIRRGHIFFLHCIQHWRWVLGWREGRIMPWISAGLGHPLDAPAIYKGLGRAARDDVATLSGGHEARQTCYVVYV